MLNLETGSLAVEAALKMMLSRFDTLDGSAPVYAGRIPVFLVMADNDGGVTAGYHGTTVLAQMLRGLWPSLAENAKRAARRACCDQRPRKLPQRDGALEHAAL